MSWLFPSALAIAGLAALAAIALHFIARSRPLAEPLPTARFVPVRPIHARTRSIALSDALLLLLRIAAIATLGAAIAAPVGPARGRVARIIVADRSLDVASISEVRDTVRSAMRDGDVLVALDTIARVTTTAALTAGDGRPASGDGGTNAARGSLSAGLAAAIRAAASLAMRADSIELVLVSPVATDERDSATMRIRESWPGRVRVIRVAAAGPVLAQPRVEVVAGPNDGVQAGLALAGFVGNGGSIRVVRGRVSAGDSVWASRARHVLVHWPASDADAAWPRRPTIDAIGGVTSSTGTLVSRFPRLWTLTGPAVARWADGEPAAVEHRIGDGCIRDVGVLLDDASDVTLRTPFRAFARALLAPCGGFHDSRPVDDATLRALAGSGALAPAAAFRAGITTSSRWTPWLLLVCALLLITEWAVRKSERRLT